MSKKRKKTKKGNGQVVTTGQRHLLPFESLDPMTFERLCLWILTRSGFKDVAHYGDAGADSGRDITARDSNNRRWVLQAKRDQLGPASACKALQDAIAHRPAEGVIIASSHRVSARARDVLQAKAAEIGVEVLVWGRTELDERAKVHDEVLEEFFLQSKRSLKNALSLKISDVDWNGKFPKQGSTQVKLPPLYLPIKVTNKSQRPVFIDSLILEAIETHHDSPRYIDSLRLEAIETHHDSPRYVVKEGFELPASGESSYK